MKKILVFIAILFIASGVFANDKIVRFVDDITESLQDAKSLPEDFLLSKGFWIYDTTIKTFVGDAEIVLLSDRLLIRFKNDASCMDSWRELVSFFTSNNDYKITKESEWWNEDKHKLVVLVKKNQPISLVKSLSDNEKYFEIMLNPQL